VDFGEKNWKNQKKKERWWVWLKQWMTDEDLMWHCVVFLKYIYFKF
jgi:hypothetical protein